MRKLLVTLGLVLATPALPLAPAAALQTEDSELAALRRDASDLAKGRTIMARMAVAQQTDLLRGFESDYKRHDAAFEQRLSAVRAAMSQRPASPATAQVLADLVLVAELGWGIEDARLDAYYAAAMQAAMAAGVDYRSFVWAARAGNAAARVDVATFADTADTQLADLGRQVAADQAMIANQTGDAATQADARSRIESAARRAIFIAGQDSSRAKQLGNWQLLLGQVLADQGRGDEALALIENAATLLSSRGGAGEGEALLAFRALGDANLAMGRASQSVAAYRQACAVPVLDGLAGSALDPNTAPLLSCDTGPALALWQWTKANGPTGLIGEAFERAQAGHNVTTAARALARRGAALVAINAGLGDTLSAFDAALDQRDKIEQSLAGPRDDGSFVPIADYLNNRRTVGTLGAQLRSALPRYFDYRTPGVVSLSSLQTSTGPDAVLLRGNEAVIVIMEGPDGTPGLVFAVSRTDAAWAAIPLSSKEIGAHVQTLRRQLDLLTARRFGPFDRKLAYQLHQALLGDPAIQRVLSAAAIDTLMMVASGPMANLPPAVLVTRPPEGDDRDFDAIHSTGWLIRDKAITILPSVSALRTLRQILPASSSTPPSKPLLVFANPDFAGAGMDTSKDDPMTAQLRKLRPLPHTYREAQALSLLFAAGPDDLVNGSAASETRVRALDDAGELARARIIAWSTHALLSGEIKGLSEPALAMAYPTATGDSLLDDGLLTASEAATLSLNADIIMLSACNTAGSDGKSGESLSGLARAFFHAGARSLLVSHWSVDDAATATLIAQTATYLAKGGQPLHQSLRTAMLDLIDAKDENFAGLHEPQYWAAFVIVGAPGD